MRYFLLILAVIALAIMPFAASAQAAPIEVGDTVTGALTTDAPESMYSLTVTADASIQITLTSDDFDTYLVLSDEDGNEIATDDDSAGNLNSRISYLFTDDGTYTITATSYSAHHGGTARTGAYTLSVIEVQVETIEYGETVSGVFVQDVFSSEYRFTAAAGDSVSIALNSDDFDAYLRLLDSSGTEVTYNDDGGGSLNALIGPFLLTDGGVYTIVASSWGRNSTGSYTLALTKANVAAITANEPLEGELTASDGLAYYTFEANAGDVIDISVESDIDTNLIVRDPSGYQLASDDDSGKGDNPEISNLALSGAGTYTIIVGAPFSETGAFTIEVTRAAVPSLNDGPVVLNFSSSVNSRVLNYTAEAGDVLRLTIDLVSGSSMSPNADINLDGSTIAYGSASYVSNFSIVFTAADAGDLVINITEYSYSNAQVEVRISPAE